MNFFLLYMFSPAVISFFVQSILCRKAKRGLLRHGALLLPMTSSVIGVFIFFTECEGMFGGLGAIAALLWFIIACCFAVGYGAAWFIFFLTGKGRRRG